MIALLIGVGGCVTLAVHGEVAAGLVVLAVFFVVAMALWLVGRKT